MSKESSVPANMASNTFVADPRKANLHEEEDIGLNPLARLSYDELRQQADELAGQIGDASLSDLFMRAVTYAVHPTDDSIPLSDPERAAFDHEATHKWSQSRTFWYAVAMACMGAVVHGVDQTVINGANLFYPSQFGIADRQWILGLVNGAPYLCCFTVGTWSCEPLNNYFGRRGAIFVAAFFCFFTFIWMAVCDSWQLLFAARFFLGFGHGIKAATVPVYVAECAPPLIRGACTMTWQLWTCVGIVFGTVINLAFKDVPDTSKIVGFNWRLMFGMASIFGIILMVQIFTVPESPRWLVGNNRYTQAWTNMKKLRQNDIIAARDLYQIDIMLKEEARIIGTSKFGRFVELFTVPRNARATLASMIIFLGQNLCGLVTIAYYSSTIFEQAGFSITSALVASLGFSLIMLLFAFPAIWTIDTFGRRPLLLWTYPVMFLMSLMTGLAFYIPNDTARLAVVALGIYIFTMGYGPGQGTTPFVYAAEAFPLRVRNLGMALATAWAFFCSFFVSLTFPVMLDRFGKTGAFGFYAGWDFLLFFLILLFVPETKALALEELDNVFEVPTSKHATYQIRASGRWFKSVILRQNVKKETLYPHERAAINAQSG